MKPFVLVKHLRINRIYSNRIYNLIAELNHQPIRWSLIFTLARGHSLLHDVQLLPKPNESEQFAKELWILMLNVRKRKREEKNFFLFPYLEND